MAANTKRAVALIDTVRWVGDDGELVEFPVPVANVEQSAKGREFELPADEFDRLEKAGSVAKPRSKDAKAAKDPADAAPADADNES